MSATRYWRAVLITTISAELIYVLGRFVIRGEIAEPVRREIVTTVWRLVFVGLYLRLAWPVLSSGRWRAIGRSPLIIAALVLLFCVAPLSWPSYRAGVWEFAVFFAATPIVALREELAYRVLLAGSLSRVAPPGVAVLLSTIAFVAYHTGTQSMNPVAMSAMAALGVILCVIYFRSGSWITIVLLHTLVDWIVLFPRDWAGVPNGLVFLGNLAMMGLALAWWRRKPG